MIDQYQLIDEIKKYQPNVDQKLLSKAYEFGKAAHASQKRSSGEPYFSHPIAVAQILIEQKLDLQTIITALLHDTVEDTEVTFEEIEKNFGENISNLVSGVTKLTKIENLSTNQKTAENFRKLVVAMSQDIRVLLVKLADRLHNMRTLDYIKNEEKRKRIAKETVDIYAALAERIGMYKVRNELQDLAFAHLHREVKEYICQKLDEFKEKKSDLIDNIIAKLTLILTKEKIQFKIMGREKNPYSIWKKMKKRKVSFDNIYDVMAFRIIVENFTDCYKILGAINYNYNMIPGSFKDYISTPKENGYQSIHVAILGPENKKIEIQIRDQKMHEVSEMGLAAHWQYKQDVKNSKDSQQYRWIRELINLFEQSGEALEVLQNHKLTIHKDQVFCFTPDGDVFNLPNGATVVDFAYNIHSQIGQHCVGAKINGHIVELRYKLENGDQVEIITDDDSMPSASWLHFVTTSKARTAIKHFIKANKFKEGVKLGKAILKKYFHDLEIEFREKKLIKTLPALNKKSLNDLYCSIAKGEIEKNKVVKVIYPDLQKAQEKEAKNNDQQHNIEGLIENIQIDFAQCCNPIFGDEIVGLIKIADCIKIHRKDCENLKNFTNIDNKLINLIWKKLDKTQSHLAKIKIIMLNKSGSLAEVSGVLAKNKINIANIAITNKTSERFELNLEIEVKDSQILADIISVLSTLKKVLEIHRV